MANSLIELYGGGMAGKSNNYQLGGRIAGAKRRRDYQGELRGLRQKQEEANRRKKTSGMLGTIGSLVGGTLGFMVGGPGGAAIGAGLGRGAGESSYAREDYSGGKYAQETRGDLRETEDDYRSAIGEKMLVDAAKAYFMPGMYEKGAGWLKGLGSGGESAIGAGTGLYSASPTPGTIGVENVLDMPSAGIPTEAPTIASGFGQSANPFGLDVDIPNDWRGNPYLVDYAGRGGGLIGMTVPQYGNGGPMERGFGYNSPIGSTADSAQQAWFGNDPNVKNQLNQLNQSGWSGVNLDWSGYQGGFNPFGQYARGAGGAGGVGGVGGAGGGPSAPYTPGYGTATNVTGALTQMGMGDIVNDPRFAQYAGDLPDFQMGYAQQVGDIYTGAQQAARGMRGQQRQAAGQRGFSGSGIGQRQSQQAFGDLRTDVARQRRGVVEGYQADLLSAIGDIEQKGEFEFTGTPSESLKQQMTVEELMATGLTANEAQDAFYAQQTSRDFG